MVNFVKAPKPTLPIRLAGSSIVGSMPCRDYSSWQPLAHRQDCVDLANSANKLMEKQATQREAEYLTRTSKKAHVCSSSKLRLEN